MASLDMERKYHRDKEKEASLGEEFIPAIIHLDVFSRTYYPALRAFDGAEVYVRFDGTNWVVYTEDNPQIPVDSHEFYYLNESEVHFPSDDEEEDEEE